MEPNARIAQFENMTQADPENEMAHFSLGTEYTKIGRHGDAARAFLACTRLAPGMSKAYQLAAEALLAAGDKAQATEVAERGFAVADERGDQMPRKAIEAVLKSLGRPIPQSRASRSAAGGAAGFVCKRTGRTGTQLARAPFKGPIGEWIHRNISHETWHSWIGQGTKVINELRLDLSRDEDAVVYDQHMREFLGIDDKVLEEIQGPLNEV